MTSVGLDLWVFGGYVVQQYNLSGMSVNGPKMSGELWRFTTSTRVWELVDNSATNLGNKIGHTMTSVGLDLYIHGGYTETSTYYGEGEV